MTGGDLTTSTSASASRRGGPGSRSGRDCRTGISDRPPQHPRLPGTLARRQRDSNSVPQCAHRSHVPRRQGAGIVVEKGPSSLRRRHHDQHANAQNGPHRLVVITHARQIRPNDGVSRRTTTGLSACRSLFENSPRRCSGLGDPKNPPAGSPLFSLHFNRVKHPRARNG